jgi:ABC-type polysaccharide/polyol phosphate export permease
LTYGLDSVRASLIGTTPLLPLNWEMVLLILFMFVMLGIGTAAFRSLERRVRMLGTLGQH